MTIAYAMHRIDGNEGRLRLGESVKVPGYARQLTEQDPIQIYPGNMTWQLDFNVREERESQRTTQRSRVSKTSSLGRRSSSCRWTAEVTSRSRCNYSCT